VTGPRDPLTPLARALAADEGLRKALLVWARRHMATPQDALDLVQQTLAAALEREAEWDADNVPLARFVGPIMNAQSRTLRRRVRRHAGPAFDEELGQHAAADVPDPERALVERDAEIDRRRVKEDLRARLAADTAGQIPLQVLELAENDVRRPAAFASAIGCSVKEIYAAQRRIAYHAERLMKRAPGRDEALG
jgi:DNA-directed RNA polymerase specialized sigma24 family protein